MQYTMTGSKVAANVLHFRQPGAGSLDLVNLGESLEGWHAAQLAGRQHVNVALNKIILTDLTSDTGQSIEYTTGLPNVGTLSGDPMPNQVAAVASLYTAFRGRSFRGRIFHLGLTEAQVAGNHLATGIAGQLEAAYQGLILLTMVGNPDYQLVVVSYWRNKVLRSQGLATDVVRVSVNSRVDSQRRRMPRA